MKALGPLVEVAIATVQRRFLPHGLRLNLCALSSLAHSTDGESSFKEVNISPVEFFFFF